MAADGSVAVVGAGDYIGGAIAERFAREGYRVFGGRRNGDALAPLAEKIGAARAAGSSRADWTRATRRRWSGSSRKPTKTSRCAR